MKILTTKKELRLHLKQIRNTEPNTKIGLVPTMGYLHQGHVELLKQAKLECDLLVISIFVNPLQFNESSDFENYPIDNQRDDKVCEQSGVDIIFRPSAAEMYTEQPLLAMKMPGLTFNMCGQYRPGHFEGVLMVVARLLVLILPDRAYFGKKDYQQYLVLRRLAFDLDLTTTVIGLPTVREDSGLAMSSRNARLSARGREQASLIYRGLKMGVGEFRDGSHKPAEITEIIIDIIESGTLNKVEYLEILDRDTLEPMSDLQTGKVFLIATAVYCEGIRLIDNIEVE